MRCILVDPGLPAVSVEISIDEIRSFLGCISFAYPYKDPVCLVHDDDGIANQRMPNRTINGQIMPGPFYILGINDSGNLIDLSPELQNRYLALFSTPEIFPSGCWRVISKTEVINHTTVFSLKSIWEELK